MKVIPRTCSICGKPRYCAPEVDGALVCTYCHKPAPPPPKRATDRECMTDREWIDDAVRCYGEALGTEPMELTAEDKRNAVNRRMMRFVKACQNDPNWAKHNGENRIWTPHPTLQETARRLYLEALEALGVE
mgnify:FL=1